MSQPPEPSSWEEVASWLDLEAENVPAATRDLRGRLLRLVERDAPEVLLALDARVAPAFARAPFVFGGEACSGAPVHRERGYHDEAVEAAHQAAITERQAAIERWGHEAWRIPRDGHVPLWLHYAACGTLALWMVNPRLRGHAWAPLTHMFWTPIGKPLVIEVRGWHPTQETPEEYEAVVLEAARQEARAHVTACRHRGATGEWRPNGRHREVERQLRWLISYQVKGRAARWIAGPSRVTPSAVEKAVERLAETLGLPLRVGRHRRAR